MNPPKLAAPICKICGNLAAPPGGFRNYRKRIEKERAEDSTPIPLASSKRQSDRRLYSSKLLAPHARPAYKIIARVSSLIYKHSLNNLGQLGVDALRRFGQRFRSHCGTRPWTAPKRMTS